MKIIVKYDSTKFPAVLRMAIHDAPHRRMHHATIQEYRQQLHRACFMAGLPVPFDEVVDVELNFVNPTSPDAGGSYMAWEQAVDGKTLKGPAVFTDDALVGKLTVIRTFPNGSYDSRGQVRRKGQK